jgi:hypothetical protein
MLRLAALPKRRPSRITRDRPSAVSGARRRPPPDSRCIPMLDRAPAEVLGVSTPTPVPASLSTAWALSSRGRLPQCPARPELLRTTSSRATSSTPMWLGLGQPSSVVPGVPRCLPSPLPAAPPVISSAQSPGFSQCPASRLTTSWARHCRHRLLRTRPGLSWQGRGSVHTPAPSQRPRAQLTRRAEDTHSIAVLATDAHG